MHSPLVQAFYGCSSLVSVKRPAGLTSIRGGALLRDHVAPIHQTRLRRPRVIGLY